MISCDRVPLHSTDPTDEAWLASDLSLAYQSRRDLRESLSKIRNWGTISLILNDIPRTDTRSLVTIQNDCPQWARKKGLKQLKARKYSIWEKCIEAISDFQVNKPLLDPNNLFPNVYTNKFLESLVNPSKNVAFVKLLSQRAMICFGTGLRGADTKKLPCCKRCFPLIALSDSASRGNGNISSPVHPQTISTSMELTLLIILDYVAEELAPADLTNFLVAIRHVPRDG